MCDEKFDFLLVIFYLIFFFDLFKGCCHDGIVRMLRILFHEKYRVNYREGIGCSIEWLMIV